MTRPCAKYARLNCEHRQKNSDGKTPSDIFYVGLPTYARCGLFLGLVRRRAGKEHCNCEHRQTNDSKNCCRLFVGLLTCPLRGLFFGSVLCRNKHKRAMTARFLSVAKGNISRLRDAQAFHAAVKRPPYFMFARQRRHFTAGAACPACIRPACATFRNGNAMRCMRAHSARL